MELCVPWHSHSRPGWNNWRDGCTQLRWATGSRSIKEFLQNGANSFSTGSSRRYVFIRRDKTPRASSVILKAYKPIASLKMSSGYAFVAHSNFFEHALGAAPTARRMPAQGNALGFGIRRLQCALKGRRSPPPFQGGRGYLGTIPRALPWAGILRRFQRRKICTRQKRLTLCCKSRYA